MNPKDQKKTKKPSQKNSQIPKFPKNAKIIEINLKNLIAPIILFVVFISAYVVWMNSSTEKIVYNEKK